MSGYLVDTNVISEFERLIPDAHVMLWLRSVDPNLLFASVITFGELRLGIENLMLANSAPTWKHGYEPACRDDSPPSFFRSPKPLQAYC